MNFEVCDRGRVETNDFLVAKVGISLPQFFVNILVDPEDRRTRSIACEILVSIFSADEQRGSFAGTLDRGESDGGTAQPVITEIVGGFALNAH
jgi:hypothetical protein